MAKKDNQSNQSSTKLKPIRTSPMQLTAEELSQMPKQSREEAHAQYELLKKNRSQKRAGSLFYEETLEE
jgi:hypothetical protein